MSVALTNQIFKLEKKVSELKSLLTEYKKGYCHYVKAYSILMEHWECFPADIKIDIDEQLKKENL